MKNGNHTKAKVLTLIPVIVLVVTVICLVLATILEGPTGRGFAYTIFAFIGIINLFFAPLPCLVVAIIGTLFAAKAVKEGMEKTRKFFLLGIFEIVVNVIGVLLAMLMFVAGQGV